jgi:hypothetical protein
LPIGSGTVASGCKQVVSSRLKGAGMIWGVTGARQIVKVRAWLKCRRWQEAMALRPRRMSSRLCKRLSLAYIGNRSSNRIANWFRIFVQL